MLQLEAISTFWGVEYPAPNFFLEVNLKDVLIGTKKKCTSKSTCLPMANWISNAHFETWNIELQLNSPTKTQHTPNPKTTSLVPPNKAEVLQGFLMFLVQLFNNWALLFIFCLPTRQDQIFFVGHHRHVEDLESLLEKTGGLEKMDNCKDENEIPICTFLEKCCQTFL